MPPDPCAEWIWCVNPETLITNQVAHMNQIFLCPNVTPILCLIKPNVHCFCLTRNQPMYAVDWSSNSHICIFNGDDLTPTKLFRHICMENVARCDTNHQFGNVFFLSFGEMVVNVIFWIVFD
eukprot:TRINITY_DN65533_c0_g2_i4.p2 TRINITY_DN65533_c0_g2~~TRINITY_DN65533_c0_g2_i4.p2  ORF type:complete len:122 (+),score=4.00 TRINITY_DN65533_c0_g2_i4:446-811(+)